MPNARSLDAGLANAPQSIRVRVGSATRAPALGHGASTQVLRTRRNPFARRSVRARSRSETSTHDPVWIVRGGADDGQAIARAPGPDARRPPVRPHREARPPSNRREIRAWRVGPSTGRPHPPLARVQPASRALGGRSAARLAASAHSIRRHHARPRVSRTRQSVANRCTSCGDHAIRSLIIQPLGEGDRLPAPLPRPARPLRPPFRGSGA